MAHSDGHEIRRSVAAYQCTQGKTVMFRTTPGGDGTSLNPARLLCLLLTLAPMDLVFLGIDPNYGQVIQGSLIVVVVMIAGLFDYLRERK